MLISEHERRAVEAIEAVMARQARQEAAVSAAMRAQTEAMNLVRAHSEAMEHAVHTAQKALGMMNMRLVPKMKISEVYLAS